MPDRYQGYTPTVPGRTSTYNPARASVPTSVGYSSMYAGDMHVVPSASHGHHITPRGYTTSVNAAGVPTTTRTYAVVQQDSRAVSKSRDIGRPRRSTLDSSSRPPVIITTTQLDRPHASSSHTSHARSGSPTRDDYRDSDDQIYSEPASSVRSRSSTRPYHASNSNTTSGRHRERGDSHLSAHDYEPYHTSRSSITHPSDPRHSTAAIDYGTEGYQYTNAGELVKYDLDHSKPGRPSRRQDSLDGGYYRPNTTYDVDRRNSNVNATHDLNRFPSGPSRHAEGRGGGPPPSTRGFDKINRGYDVRDVLPATSGQPLASSTLTHLERPGSASGRRPRPLSLHQEGDLRSSHHDEYNRTREDERHMRDLRDRDRERDYERRGEPSRYQDDSVASRGFGIRTDLLGTSADSRDRRRDTRLDEPRRRSDEDLCYGHDRDKDGRRRSRLSPVGDLRGRGQRVSSEDGHDRSERSRVRDSLATGLGAVATAIGLVPAVFKSQDKREQDTSQPPRRRSPLEERDTRKEAPRQQRGPEPAPSHERPREPVREKQPVRNSPPLMIREKDPTQERDPLREIIRDKEPAREREYLRQRDPVRSERDYVRESAREDARAFSDPVRRSYTDAQSSSQAARHSGSDSDDTKRRRRSRNSNLFDPNDASDLKQLKEQLASMDAKPSNRDRDRDTNRPPAADRPSRARSQSPSKDRASHGSPPQDYLSRQDLGDEPRGREVASPESDNNKQVRVVSPPKEKPDGKPLRGILKQPKASFPEEDNPVREGVAPHKEDKKLKEVPPGARWTKINRKIVNPEALTVGKERFEVRDDFVIVLRVLSKDEIQEYAAATQVLRERRRNKHDSGRDRSHDGERSIGDDDVEDSDRPRRHRRVREGRDGEEGQGQGQGHEEGRDRKRDDEGRRSHRQYDEEEYHGRSKEGEGYRHGQHSARSFKEREREREREAKGEGRGESKG
ncbi:hypothetical protein E4U25_003705 [Claviceps purpurea]|nr:hypothetical protein E4U28_007568 [Claviceps purpurea]KAG6244121.1 hypothetical protein E4U25_003705 [Claviceps purpurea]